MAVRIQQGDFDAGAEIRGLSEAGGNGEAGGGEVGGGVNGGFPGAVVGFIGLVRDWAEDKRITAMTIEHYPGMTEAALEKIRAEAMARWPITKAVIIHRIGRLEAGAQIVFVGCTSPHREAAFAAAGFMMDYLKTDAPFWKAEEIDGKINWVEADTKDTTARKNWN